MKYILVTAAKNEGENLPKLIDSVARQTVKPIVWVILDDGSTDNTWEVLEEGMTKHLWIRAVRSNENNPDWDIGRHLSYLMITAFDIARKYCAEENIHYDFLANIDGDMVLEPEYFEKLLKEFQKDEKLGIASGVVQYYLDGKIIKDESDSDEPSGGMMVIRRKCFEECGGIQMTCCWDSVLKAKARLKGWKTKRFQHAVVTETRYPGSENFWKRGIHTGESVYELDLHPLHVFFRGLKLLKNKPILGVAYFVGYFNSVIQRRSKVECVEVRNYFRNKWRIRLNLFR